MIDWRASDAAANEDKVAAHALLHAYLEDVYVLWALEGDQAACAEARQFAALIRSKKAGYAACARETRNSTPDRDGDGTTPLELAAATTTRHVRRLAP